MGTYYYSLRTKKRSLTLGGVKSDVHAVEFAYKHEPKHFRMTEARMEAAWAGRDAPAYIAWGGFEEGNNVYRGWPKDVVVASEYIVDGLDFVGILVSNGKGGFTVQEWTSVELNTEVAPLPDIRGRSAALAKMGLNPEGFRIYARKRIGDVPSKIVACFRDPKDAVIGKVILA